MRKRERERDTHTNAKEKLATKPSKPGGVDEYMEHAQERERDTRQNLGLVLDSGKFILHFAVLVVNIRTSYN